jgi:hypothetical protein
MLTAPARDRTVNLLVALAITGGVGIAIAIVYALSMIVIGALH